MKTFNLFLLLISTVIVLTGCWNRVEINDIAVVTAIGLDLAEENDHLRLSLQVAIPSKLGTSGGSGGESAKGSIVVSETGPTISEAFRNIQGKLPRQIFFSQSRVLLIGEALAKKGVSPIIDFHMRFNQPRINSFIMFTKGEASAILQGKPNFENISAEEMKELNKLNIGPKVYVRDFLYMLLTDGLEPFAPQFTLEPFEVDVINKSQKMQAINGAAVFKGDKLVGWMDQMETRGLLWLRNEITRGVVTIKIPQEQGGGNISMEIAQSDTKIVPTLKNGGLKMTLQVTSTLNVLENDAHIDLFDTENIGNIQDIAEKEISSRIQLSLDKAQKEYKSDIFGFGQALYRKHPKEWNTTYKKKWEQEFPSLQVTIHTKAFVRRIGLTK